MDKDPPAHSISPARTWHAHDYEQVMAELDTTAEGLTDDEATKRLATYGPNVLPKAQGDTVVDLLWRQIHSPLIWVLIASGGVAMAIDPTDGIKNGLVILTVVVLNTVIGFVQEFRASKAIEALSKMVPENVTVVRQGTKSTVAAAELVPGDIVLLASGDKVPADMRLVHVRNLQIEEATLTGESVPTEKTLSAVDLNAGLGDQTCMAFGGTLVTYGTGTAVVVETGAKTELGKISSMLRETTDLQTPLTQSLARIGKNITVAIIAISVLMLGVGSYRAIHETGTELLPAIRETAIFAISLAVGAIPEGLPAIVTITLAIGVQRMAARRAVIRKLPAVETLGSTTVICSDKTGTLTRNEMTVQAIWTPISGEARVSGVGYEPKGVIAKEGKEYLDVPKDFQDLLLAGTLCNDSKLEHQLSEDGDTTWRILGDPTEGALVVVAEKSGVETVKVRDQHARLDAIPFESENQFMATLHNKDGGLIILKGAPEAVLKRCQNSRDRDALANVEKFAGEGMRVLGFASKPFKGTGIEMSDVADGFTFLGLQAMIDPPRTEAVEAIRQCHAAGITVKMITGDHQSTAAAIGRQLNILAPGQTAISGAELAGMNHEQIREAVVKTNVFARVAPEHKLRLVRALQERTEIVAMTGDGVNDAPALKQANIGVAMGITGTSVSKEAAAVVLTDDNFASIAAAVEEGRHVYDNLVKSLAFVLPTNLGLALILMWAVFFFPFNEATVVLDGIATNVRELLLPLSPTQLLWINLVATVALAIPLAFEAKEPNVMKRPPRDTDTPILSGFIIVRTFMAAMLMAAGCIGLFLWEYQRAIGDDGNVSAALSKAQTSAVTTVIFFQFFYMLNCRSLKDNIFSLGFFSNQAIFVGAGLLLIFQSLFIYTTFMNRIFGSAPLTAQDVMWSAIAGMIIWPVISIEKFLRNHWFSSNSVSVSRP